MNDIIQNMYNRRSVRKYTEKEVSNDDIDLLLKAAMAAPSACNKQPWEFYVVRNKDILEKVRNSSRYTQINAPVAVIVCGNTNRTLSKKNNDFFIQDCSSAITHILLAATSLGLGSLWCGAYPMNSVVKKLRDALNLNDDIIPLGIVYIGYRDKESEPRTQYNLEYVHNIE